MANSDDMFRRLERELFAAHVGTPDLATIDRLYANDFLSTNADGRVVDKQGWLDILKAGQFPVERITTDDFKVRKYSGTAIVTGRSAYFNDGQKMWEVRHTQVWVDQSGTGAWRVGRALPCQPRPKHALHHTAVAAILDGRR
jgi:ketosteroid isomerase-like protein